MILFTKPETPPPPAASVVPEICLTMSPFSLMLRPISSISRRDWFSSVGIAFWAGPGVTFGIF